MSVEANPMLMNFYANPNYWDGHSLGIGETTRATGLEFSLKEGRYAKSILAERVRTDREMMTLESFNTGDVFEPAEYPSGTIVLYRHHKLYGPPLGDDYDLEDLLQRPAMPIAATTSPSFSHNAPHAHVSDGKRWYSSSVCWGVVPIDNQPGKLSVAPASYVHDVGGRVKVRGPVTTTKSLPVIGKVRHAAAEGMLKEKVDRIPILHVVAYGETVRRKHRIFDLAGRLALNRS